MNLEHQVAPIELARNMRDVGFPQETCFVWVGDDLLPNPARRNDWAWAGVHTEDGGFGRVAAPTVAEMGEWCPDQTVIQRDRGVHRCYLRNGAKGWINGDGTTEATARAIFLIAAAAHGALDPVALEP